MRLFMAAGVGSLLMAAAFYAAVVALDSEPANPLPYRAGQYISQDIRARVTFSVLSRTKLEEESRKAAASTPAVFKYDGGNIDKFVTNLKTFAGGLKSATQPSDIAEAPRKQWGIESQAALDAWKQIEPAAWDRQVEALRQELASTPLVTPEDFKSQQGRGSREVMLVIDGKTRMVNEISLVSVGDKAKADALSKKLVEPLDPRIAPGLRTQLLSVLAEPNYYYDAQATDEQIARAVADLQKATGSPKVRDTYEAGKVLVEKGKVLSADDIRLLRQENKKYLAQASQASWFYQARLLAGRWVVILFICLLLFAYLARYASHIIRSAGHFAAVLATLLAALAINKLAMTWRWNEPLTVLTVGTAAAVLTIAYNQRLALMISVVLALLTTFVLREPLTNFIILTAACAATVMQLRDVRRRLTLVQIGGLSAMVVLVVSAAIGLSSGQPSMVTLIKSLADAAGMLAVGFLIEILLPLIERVFRVATSMTLLEWCDPSGPLLRRLAVEAPGTFSHSLLLGTMCEAAAETIGVRGLLARAGAYYHDIGKINKPEYFVENQADIANPHAKLSPAMSLLIIIGHVKDGLELAREYGLPVVLREFIATHHGSTLVQYFYHAATQQRKADSDRAPDEVEFRYPGPRPGSREAAILMLADASESSVRAMPDPTPGRIETQVHTMVTRRLMDGQLDDCELTLREVHLVEASLIRSLMGIYHARIAYPKPSGKKAAPSEQPATKPQNGRSATNGSRPAPQQPPSQPPSSQLSQSEDM